VEEDIKNHRSAWWYNADDVWDAAFMNLKGRTAAEQEALQEEFTLRSAALYK
jgi:hypothetical protein